MSLRQILSLTPAHPLFTIYMDKMHLWFISTCIQCFDCHMSSSLAPWTNKSPGPTTPYCLHCYDFYFCSLNCYHKLLVNLHISHYVFIFWLHGTHTDSHHQNFELVTNLYNVQEKKTHGVLGLESKWGHNNKYWTTKIWFLQWIIWYVSWGSYSQKLNGDTIFNI